MTTTTMTTTTTKTLTALALAAAALTAMVGSSEAMPRFQKGAATSLLQAHGAPTVFQLHGLAGVHAPISGITGVFRPLPITLPNSGLTGILHPLPISGPPIVRPLPLPIPFPFPIPLPIPHPIKGPPISCFTCTLPHGGQGGARPPGWHPPYHDPGYGWGWGNHWPYHGYGNRWGYGYYDWYRWHPAYYGGAPVAAAPVAAPPAPVGGCLTKKMLPNGAELLQDICTQQSAIAQPQALSAR